MEAGADGNRAVFIQETTMGWHHRTAGMLRVEGTFLSKA
jgi:hypothetical protein